MEYLRRKKRKEDSLPTDYVNNAALQAALVDWYNVCAERATEGKEEPQIPNTICLAVMQICDRLATKHNFRDYSYIDEMRDSGLLKCIKALKEKKYNPYKYSNPFAYFTTVAFYEYIQVIKDEQKESYVKHASLVNLHQEASLDPNNDHDINQLTSVEDINWALIEKFQPKAKKSKIAEPDKPDDIIEEAIDNELTADLGYSRVGLNNI